MGVIAKSARVVAMVAVLLAIGRVVHAQTSTPGGASSQDDEVVTAPVDIDGERLGCQLQESAGELILLASRTVQTQERHVLTIG
jgi:hypothetical protein